MTAVVMASSIAGLLLTTGFPVALRIEIRLLSETRSVLEYNFPRIAVGHVYQFLLGNMINTRNETIPTEVVNRLVSTVNLTTFVRTLFGKIHLYIFVFLPGSKPSQRTAHHAGAIDRCHCPSEE